MYSMRRRKKRKQVEDGNPDCVTTHSIGLHATLVALMISQCLAFGGGYTVFGCFFVLATGPSIGVHPSWSDTYSCLEAGVLE